MRISGFTFVRNALDLDYPIVESVTSALPIVDEFIVNVGESTDETLRLVESIGSPKIRIIRSRWDPAIRTGGRVLAEQTDIALSHCRGDWALYLQADEVMHEDDLPLLRKALARNLHDPRVEGLLFDFVHFYGNYSTIGLGRKWYGREIRAVRLGLGVSAWRDAQGFRLKGRKLRVVRSGAVIYHYGWVRDPVRMKAKRIEMDKLWHDDRTVREKHSSAEPRFAFDTGGRLGPFRGSHPAVMAKRMRSFQSSEIQPARAGGGDTARHRLLDWIEEHFGWSPGLYKNYKLLREAGRGRPAAPRSKA